MKVNKKSALLFVSPLLLVAGLYTFFVSGCASATVVKGDPSADDVGSSKSDVVYFTYAQNIGDISSMGVDALTAASLHMPTENTVDNTSLMVQEIKKRTSADEYPIVVKDPYDPEFDVMKDRARSEIEKYEKVTLKTAVPDLGSYDTIYIGSPIWWYTAPAPVRTFLESVNLKGKKIVPFGIHRGSGMKALIKVIRETQPDALIADGFTVSAEMINDKARSEFNTFLNSVIR